jgi:hypothetical protein
MDAATLNELLHAMAAACAAARCPLGDRQQQVLHQAAMEFIQKLAQRTTHPDATNPLDQLTEAERQLVLDFVQRQTEQQLDWRATLLNDWLLGADSGPIQAIRDRYGIFWLTAIQSVHLAPYRNQQLDQPLQVGDRIEVTNALWEWVPVDDSEKQDWFPCTVIQLSASPAAPPALPQVNGTVRFDTGDEYDIPALYDWNRPYWRWREQ